MNKFFTVALIVGIFFTLNVKATSQQPDKAVKQAEKREMQFKEELLLRPVSECFGPMLSGAENSKGEVFILDSRQHLVHHFDAKGKLIGSVGQKGEGPGDFKNPFSLSILENDFIVVEGSQARLSLFDANLHFLELHNLGAQDSRLNRIYPISCTSWCMERKNEDKTLSIVLSLAGKASNGRSLLSLPNPEFTAQATIIQCRERSTTPVFLFNREGKNSILAASNSDELLLLDNLGETVRTVKMGCLPQKLSEKERLYIDGQIRNSFKRVLSQSPEMAKTINDAIQQILAGLPEYKNLFSSIALNERYIWVQLSKNDLSNPNETVTVAVYEIDNGRYIGKFHMDDWPLFWGADSAYFLSSDDQEDVVIRKKKMLPW